MAEVVKKSKAATEISYTEKEMAAIEILLANKGNKLSAKDLGIPTVTLTSLRNKGNDARPMAEGFTRIVVNAEDYDFVCPTCGAKGHHKRYWVD